jgi:hypothetical protein
MEPHACKLDLRGDGLFQVGGMSQDTFSDDIKRAAPLD